MRRTEKRTQNGKRRAADKRKRREAAEVERLTGVHAKRVERAREAKRKLTAAKDRIKNGGKR